MEDIYTRVTKELAGILTWFQGEIAALRTGRATPALVENIEVDYHGAKTPLKHIASLSTPDARTITIQPWDKAALEPIQKALEAFSVNLAPIADKDTIRLALPALTEERRKELLKLLGVKAEEARVRSRKTRDEAWKTVQRREKEKAIREDEKFRAKGELQKKIDEFNEKLDGAKERKERDISEV